MSLRDVISCILKLQSSHLLFTMKLFYLFIFFSTLTDIVVTQMQPLLHGCQPSLLTVHKKTSGVLLCSSVVIKTKQINQSCWSHESLWKKSPLNSVPQHPLDFPRSTGKSCSTEWQLAYMTNFILRPTTLWTVLYLTTVSAFPGQCSNTSAHRFPQGLQPMEGKPFLPCGLPEPTAYDSAGFKNVSGIQQAFEKDVAELAVMGYRSFLPSGPNVA